MRSEKIGIVMKKNSVRDKIIIELQKRGYRVYVVPEGKDMYDVMIEMELSIILLGEPSQNSFLGYIEEIKDQKKLADIPIIVILYKTMQQTDMIEILKKGAMDIVYIKDKEVEPLIITIDSFLKDNTAEFHLETTKVDNNNILKITGELDITNTFILKSKFDSLYAEGERKFILDFGNLESLESVGIGVMIYMNKKIAGGHGSVRYIIKSERIVKLLSLVKLDKYFEVFENVEDLVTFPEQKKKTKIVIIDDAKFMRMLIRHVLEEEADFEIYDFANPVEALQEIDNIKPEIVLVDYEMPEMNGIEFIEKFNPSAREIPTIMLTTVTDVNVALRAIRLGASDFLNKPFEKEELIHTIKKIIRENGLKKENERLLTELKRREKELERKNTELNIINSNIEEELKMASEIQKRLLPQTLPILEDFRFAVKYLPSQDIGGDFYDFMNMSNESLGIAFADISGHGIPAALLSTMFKVFLTTYTKDILFPSEAMDLMNDVIADSFPEGKFISVFYMILDTKTKKIRYCKAAQEPALYINSAGEIEELSTAGPVLGLFSARDFPDIVKFEDGEIEMKAGDKIFLYTDGIVEAKNREEEFYGLERLKKVLIENRNENINTVMEKVYQDLLEFVEGLPIVDDLTFLGVERI